MSAKKKWKTRHGAARRWLSVCDVETYYDAIAALDAVTGKQGHDRVEEVLFYIKEAFRQPQYVKHFKECLLRKHGHRLPLP